LNAIRKHIDEESKNIMHKVLALIRIHCLI